MQNRVLFVDGTEAADGISLSFSGNSVTTGVNGTNQTFDRSVLDSIHVRAFGGNDHMTVGSGGQDPILLDFGAGDDVAEVTSTDVSAIGGTGNDSLILNVNNSATVPAHALSFDGGPGIDSIGGFNSFLSFDLRQYPTVENASGYSSLIGNDLDNKLTLFNDGTVLGGAGNDTIRIMDDGAGPGTSGFVDGGDGNDHIEVGFHETIGLHLTLNGGAGNDTIFGSTTDYDSISGGDGNDYLEDQADPSHYPALAGTVNGGAGDDTLVSDKGAPDLLIGGSGTDTADYTGQLDNLNLSLDNVANDGAANENDNLRDDIENVRGGSGNDRITGSAVANVLSGKAGNDTLLGNGGNDQLYGDDGNDSLVGGGGTDYVGGGAGNDTLSATSGTLQGSTGDDVLVLKGNLGNLDVHGGDGGRDIADFTAYPGNAGRGVVVSLDNVANDGDMYYASMRHTNVHSDVEQVRGSQFADEISGSDGPNMLAGKGGNDTIHGNGGNDSLYGDDGSDLIGGAGGNDYVGGGAGNDYLYGGDGNDTVAGSDGNDYLDGQANADTVDGGNGTDTARKDSLDSLFNVEQVIT